MAITLSGLAGLDPEAGKRLYRACCFSLDEFQEALEDIFAMDCSDTAREEAGRQIRDAEKSIGKVMHQTIWGDKENPYKTRGGIVQ